MSTYRNKLPILWTESISKSYDGKTIIDDINVELMKGELVSLLGVSGAGKTTLFHLIAGLTIPDTGNVFLESQDITGTPGKISYMLQKDMLLRHKKIIDNVSLPLLLSGMKKKEAREKAAVMFDEFGLEGTQELYPVQLSGGMRQRAALLRTYLSSHGVVLLDEPFSALDYITRKAMNLWYLDMMEKIDLSTLFITHDIDEAITLSDRIYVLSGKPGKITEEFILPAREERPQQFDLTQEYIEIKRQILSCLDN